MNTPTSNPQVNLAGRLDPGATAICAAQPADDFGADTASLLHQMSGRPVVCVNVSRPADPERAFIAMADELEVVRRELRLGPWVFWGMSGGGWMGHSPSATRRRSRR